MAQLKDIAFSFLKIGTTAFGGPAAHTAMMQTEFVEKKKWLTQQEFLDLVSATNLIPGPNSTELAIHIGYKQCGWKGLLTAGISFILPAFLIVWTLAWVYVKYQSLPALQNIFSSVTPVIIAIIMHAVISLSKVAIKNNFLFSLAGVSLIAFVFTGNELLILFLAAVASYIWQTKNIHTNSLTGVTPLFFYFLKIGSMLFGSGYVLIAFLQNDLVNKYKWISQQQLVDAIAIGQFTPGPVFTTATFIGYLVAGHSGAILATIGIFLPAFFFVAISAPFMSKLRSSVGISYALDGLNVASLSLMLGAAFLLTRSSELSLYFIIAMVISFIGLIKYKINSTWLIIAALIVGLFNV